MIRFLCAAVALMLPALAAAASAQTYGQPVYLNAYGRPVGGSPLSEVETRSYVGTGRWADGYADRPHVIVPGLSYGHGQDRARGHGYGDPHAYRSPHHNRGRSYGYRSHQNGRAGQGYRDEWGYDDDRPRSVRGWSGHGPQGRRDRDCGCGDVYLYDR